MRAWLYVIHFEIPHHHARHYTGVTTCLKSRLERHRVGQGSRLLAALRALNANWRLATLYEIDDAKMYDLERLVKHRHNGPVMCLECNKTIPPLRHWDQTAKQYDIGLIPFNTTSESYK